MSEIKLFKERTGEESYASFLALLRGDRTTCELELLGTANPTPFSGNPKRSFCTGLGPEQKESDGKEKRVCKCLYYYNKDPRNCDREQNKNCDYLLRKRRYRIQPGEYSIRDYEIPPYSGVTGVGEVDLILEGPGGTLYATEIKPPKDNSESLLRMIAEIVTYTLCGFKYEDKKTGEHIKTKRAIAFFEGSDQAKEYDQHKDNEDLRALLKEAEISVFCFQEIEGEKAYRICKL